MGNEQFCIMLKEAIADEEQAPIDYSKLMVSSNEFVVKLSVADIIKDERKHAETLKVLNKVFCESGN